MFGLKVPTTRALALLLSGEQVVRDKLYNGKTEEEPGALTIRASPSFVRFGNFEILAGQSFELVQQLMDFEISRNFRHVYERCIESRNNAVKSEAIRHSDLDISQSLAENEDLRKEVYLETLKEIGDTTADMIVSWERVGFVHGVMNTDNMSILGLTIDYGPFGFMDFYEKGYTPNLTDHGTFRYKYSAQGKVAAWNLVKLLVCFAPLFGNVDPLQPIVDRFMTRYDTLRSEMFLNKLGLPKHESSEQGQELINKMLDMLDTTGLDFTRFFISLEEGFQYESAIGNEMELESHAQRISNFIFVHSFDFRENNQMIDSFLAHGIQVTISHIYI